MANYNDDPNAYKLSEAAELMAKAISSDQNAQVRINAILYDLIVELVARIDKLERK